MVSETITHERLRFPGGEERQHIQPKYPSTEEWIKTMWYKYTMEYYSGIKKNKTGSFVEMWMDLEIVIQSEVKSEREKQIVILTHICGI